MPPVASTFVYRHTDLQLAKMDTTHATVPVAVLTDVIKPTDLHVEVTSMELSNGTKFVVCSQCIDMTCLNA
jgi:hypothetical protein